ncbi:DEAD/DEAH box helicase [Sutcliffiella rhizosphaerae]|uniref:ATP-dependent RecD-like DNA helicase n=1 Tax=Sutcliffiella rhizosphaerae TaxID=2880967 RepID=A0ABN8A931_9BACI|nr:AAA domain-containing protein [Sutcliffiella rhizosphaerae]CAG9621643.1 ATP-dependent RecD-like DNA helicase [Sutcliffiella rhizosphaerae]
MKTSVYIQEWKKALQAEIYYLKKFGSTRYLLVNGSLLKYEKLQGYIYYFDTISIVTIPIGSIVKVEWGGMKTEAKVLSSEGKNMIIASENHIGDTLTEAYVVHDPWELLDNLIQRLNEITESKKKRIRIKRLMNPQMPPKHPTNIIKSNVHELILRSKYNPVTFVWGPPGTGKTYTLARVAANKYFKKKKVLLLSHSNQSVDVLVKEVSSFISKRNKFQDGDILRYGSSTTIIENNAQPFTSNSLIQKFNPSLAEEKRNVVEERRGLKEDLAKSFSSRDSEELLKLESKLAKLLERMKQKELQLLENAYVIGTTLAKAAADPALYEKQYDVVIVDEASMAYVPQIAFAASLGKHLIVCGDFKQLPPIASAKHQLVDKWLKEDVFHSSRVARSVQTNVMHPHLFLLNEQRRMHPEISSFTNRYVYQLLVGDHPNVAKEREAITKRKPYANIASLMLSSSWTGEHAFFEKGSKSRVNLWHLFLSFQLVYEAYLNGTHSIAYISPYRAQAKWFEQLLEELLPTEIAATDITAATVHRFQGSERDFVIFDTVESYPFNRTSLLLTGKDSERLINVAITRARGKFVHICDSHFIKTKVSSNKTIRKLVDFQERNQSTVYPKDIGKWIQHQHPNVQWMHARKVERIFLDILHARTSIIISLPDKRKLPIEWQETLQKVKKQINILIISAKSSFPFVMIDHQCLWLGVPIEAAMRIQPPYVSIRVFSNIICSKLLKEIDL